MDTLFGVPFWKGKPCANHEMTLGVFHKLPEHFLLIATMCVAIELLCLHPACVCWSAKDNGAAWSIQRHPKNQIERAKGMPPHTPKINMVPPAFHGTWDQWKREIGRVRAAICKANNSFRVYNYLKRRDQKDASNCQSQGKRGPSKRRKGSWEEDGQNQISMKHT